MRTINDYADGNIFKPNEIWLSPKGIIYRVQSTKIGGMATLRRGQNGDGPMMKRKWDEVDNWRRKVD